MSSDEDNYSNVPVDYIFPVFIFVLWGSFGEPDKILSLFLVDNK